MPDIQIINFGEDELVLQAPAQLQVGSAVVIPGADGTQPAAGQSGRVFFAGDTGKLYTDDGTAWTLCAVTKHGDLIVQADAHTEYILADGTRAFTSDVLLANSSPTNNLHAASRGFVNTQIGAKLKEADLGIGFISGAISTGSIFARRPITSKLTGYTVRSLAVTARVAGGSSTTISLDKGTLSGSGSQIATATLASADLWKETTGLTVVVSTNDYLTATCTVAGGHQGVAIVATLDKTMT